MITEPKLPVTFEKRAVSDARASEEAGVPLMKDENYIIFHLPGGKETREYSLSDRPDKMEGYESAFDAWSKGQEAPVDGFDIRQAPFLTPAEIANCRAAKLFSVEALASASEASLKVLGMGARSIQNKAVKWLEGRNADTTKLSGKLADMETRLNNLTQENERLLAEKETLNNEINALAKVKKSG